MSRLIIDTLNPTLYVYKVSDDYLQKCKKSSIPFDKRIINYIYKSLYFSIRLTRTQDIFTNEYIDHYHTLRTDGRWIWSADLNIYTKKHNFIWLPDFMLNIQRKTPKLTDKKLLELTMLYRDITMAIQYPKYYSIEDYVSTNYPIIVEL